jgi:hypothetical protein
MGINNRRATAQTFYENVFESSSDEESDLLMAAVGMVNEQFLMPPCRGSSSKKWEANVDYDREASHVRLYKDYFVPVNPIFKEKAFPHRYRMSRELFMVILNGMREYADYFKAQYDCTDKIGFSPYQKCFAAIRQLAHGVPGDLIDDYMHMSESTCHEAMYQFCEDVIVVFGEYYLREPNTEDIVPLLSINKSRGRFPGMLGRINCMH